MSAVFARGVSLGALLCATLAACGGTAKNPSCARDTDCGAGLTCKASECVGETQCPSTQPSCATNDSCVSGTSCQGGCCAPLAAGACRSSADCAGIADKPHCDPASSACVACASNGQCTGGQICTPTGACLAGCASNANCAAGQRCFAGPSGSWCGECQKNSDCASPSQPFCVGGSCFGCATNSDCSGPTPVCNTATHGCVVCLESQNAAGVNAACADSSKPACVGGACEACAPSSSDGSSKNPACAAAAPYCNPSGDVCVGCIDNTQCKTGDYCGSDSACHAPQLTSACIGDASSTCTASTAAQVSSHLLVAAKLDHAAVVDTTVTFDLTSGAASLASGSALAEIAAVIHAGHALSDAVTVYLDAVNTNDVTVQATIGSAHEAAVIHPTAAPLTLGGFTSDKPTVEIDQTATLTVTMSAAPAAAAHVTLSNDNASIATLSTTDVVVSGAAQATATLTPVAGQQGDVTLHAVYNGGTPIDLGPIHVINRAVSALTPATAKVVKGGGTVHLTVTLDAAPLAGHAVTVTLTPGGGAGTVNGGNGTVTITSPNTSATFDFVSGSAAGTETIVAAAGRQEQQASLTVVEAANLASVSVSPSPMVAGQAATLTVALDAIPAPGHSRVFLGDYNKLFGTASKQSTYLPTFVDIPAGATSNTVQANECSGLGLTSIDTIRFGAWLPGSPPMESADVLVCPQQAAAAGGCPDTTGFTATGLAVCPTLPMDSEVPKGIETMATAQIIYNKPATAGTQQVDLIVTPGTCGHFKSAGATVTSVNLTLSAKGTSSNPNASAKSNLTFVADGNAGDTCTITAALHTGAGAPTSFDTHVKIVAAPSTTISAGDLILTKIDSTQGTVANDKQEYIEIFNPTGGAIALAGYKVVLVGASKDTIGTGTGYFDDKFSGKSEYGSVDLGALAGISSLAAGGYLVVADPDFTGNVNGAQLAKVLAYLAPAATSPKTSDALQNVPAGVFLVKSSAIIDGVTYGGPMVQATAADIGDGTTPWNWPQSGNVLDVWEGDNGFVTGLAMERIATTGDNNLDWRVSTTVNIGQANSAVTGP